MENAQADLNIESINYVPVIYKTEIEAASLTGLLPTLLIIGFLIYMMRRSADMMGGGRGRKGGGLFGGVMQSTAKLTNPSEIGVKFRYVLLTLIFNESMYLKIHILVMLLDVKRLKLK